MDAFTAGKVDAVTVTNGDALVTGANGAKSKLILVNDYSNGNDQIIAGPGIKTFKDLKGKKVGLELTLVEHLLFLKGLEKFGMKPEDVRAGELPHQRDAAGAGLGPGRAPSAPGTRSPGRRARRWPASKALFTSADVPGLIYDTWR